MGFVEGVIADRRRCSWGGLLNVLRLGLVFLWLGIGGSAPGKPFSKASVVDMERARADSREVH